MSYATTANRANPAAALGALGVPAAFGAILVLGLAVKVAVDKPDTKLRVVTVTPEVPDVPPPPPDPKPPEAQTTQQVTEPTILVPPSPLDNPLVAGPSIPTETVIKPPAGPVGPVTRPGPIVTLPSLPDPIKASPANNPSRWVTDSDYRSSWIRREYSGVAGFALSIDSTGRVSDCTITRSTGHAALDAATCRLIERRARFDPAKDSYGNAVTGSYSNSVNWRLPE